MILRAGIMRVLRLAWALSTAATAWGQAVQLAVVTARVLERTSKLPGEILPYQSVDLHARLNAFVGSVEVDVGSTVKQGQVLVRLAASEMKAQAAEAQARWQAILAQRAEAEAKLAAAQATYERLLAAAETPGAVANHELALSLKAVEAAQAAVTALEHSAQAARAQVEAQAELMSYLTLRAPFEGVITARWAHPGALVGPQAGSQTRPILRLEQISQLRLIVHVPESESAGIRLGSKVSFRVAAYPGVTFYGTIARNPHAMDPKTRTMAVEVDVANPGLRLAAGMYPEVDWPSRGWRPSLLVPASSIVTTTERSFVIRVRDGKAEWVDVVRGVAVGDQVEVWGQLKPGDTIVRRATDEIRDGAPILANPPPGPALRP